MEDEKLKKELLYMVRLAEKYDFTNSEIVSEIMSLETQRHILVSVFGKRFLRRIAELSSGNRSETSCVICGAPEAENGVICNDCCRRISKSKYAKQSQRRHAINPLLRLFNRKKKTSNNKVKADDKKQRHKHSHDVLETKKEKKPNKILSTVVIVLLSLLLVFQGWLVYLLYFSDMVEAALINRPEPPRLSEAAPTPVENQQEAYESICLDFPESAGWTVTYGQDKMMYSGRFSVLEPGENAAEREAELTDEERFDYFLTEECYMFFVSYLDAHTAKLGVVLINRDGRMIIEGSFNDGRATDEFYRFR